jgi:hypothetical protein
LGQPLNNLCKIKFNIAFPFYVLVVIWIVRVQVVDWLCGIFTYIFKYVSALNQYLPGTEMFSGRFGLCCMQTDSAVLSLLGDMWLGKCIYAVRILLTELTAYPTKRPSQI